MRRKLTIGLVVLSALIGLGLAAKVVLPTLRPDTARASAVRLLEQRKYEKGLQQLAAYAARWPAHAMAEPKIEIGEPTRLTIDCRRDGLQLTGPTIPIPASAYPDAAVSEKLRLPIAEVQEGPVWIDDLSLAYAALSETGQAAVVYLNPLTRELTTRDVPETAYAAAFEPTARILLREDAEQVLSMVPDLSGATQPKLLALSPDGTWLLFRAAASDPDWPYELWRCRPDGAEAARLSPLRTMAASVAFSPDGTRVAWFDGPRLMLAELADQEGRELQAYDVAAVLQPSAPAWSPDGRELAYGVASADRWRLVTCPIAEPSKATERSRLNSLEALCYATQDLLLQSQQELDKTRWLVSLRGRDDSFHSRPWVEHARCGTISQDQIWLAWRDDSELLVRVLWLHHPLSAWSSEELPEATLQERPTGPQAPLSPVPDEPEPTQPDVRT